MLQITKLENGVLWVWVWFACPSWTTASSLDPCCSLPSLVHWTTPHEISSPFILQVALKQVMAFNHSCLALPPLTTHFSRLDFLVTLTLWMISMVSLFHTHTRTHTHTYTLMHVYLWIYLDLHLHLHTYLPHVSPGQTSQLNCRHMPRTCFASIPGASLESQT